MKYICCRCDARAEVSVGHHVCEAPGGDEIDSAIAERIGSDYVDSEGAWHGFGQWSCVLQDCIADLTPIAISHGYRFTLTQLGADEYRVSFFHNIDTLAATALDTTPARAFARAWLRLPSESAGAA